MSQISPPLRILLIGSVVFLAAWFAFLRPGGSGGGAAPATTPATQPLASNPNGPTAKTGLGRAVQAAHGAAAKTDAHTAAVEAATGGATAPSSSAAAPATAAAPSAGAKSADPKADVATTGLPVTVAKAVAAKKVLVMLFWNPKAADDRAVRKAVRGVDRHHGKVVVQVANVKDIARYAPITQGVNVEQSPSVVVVGGDRQADLLTGYVDRVTIQQSVSDALRAAAR